MQIGEHQVYVEHKQGVSSLVAQVRPFGVRVAVTLEQLEALAFYLTNEALLWRKRETENFYTILGVSRGASDAEVKKAFRSKQQKYHPDKGGNIKTSQAINEAFETLSDPERRAQYDQTLTT